MNANDFQIILDQSTAAYVKSFDTTIQLPKPPAQEYYSGGFMLSDGSVNDKVIDLEFKDCPEIADLVKSLILLKINKFEFHNYNVCIRMLPQQATWDKSVDIIVRTWMESLVINVFVSGSCKEETRIFNFDQSLTEQCALDKLYQKDSEAPQYDTPLSLWKGLDETVNGIVNLRGVTFVHFETEDTVFRSRLMAGKGMLFDWDDISPEIENIMRENLGPNIHFSYKKE